MTRRDGAEVRRERIAKIGRLIQKFLYKSRELSLTKTIALLQYESGLTEERLREYLTILENLGQFILDIERDKIRKVAQEEETSDE